MEVYGFVFEVIGKDGLSRDLPLYLPGLASTLSFASLSVRSPYLDLLEKHFLGLNPRSLRPAVKSLILALLPGLEDETSEDFDRTLRLVESFKQAVRPANSEVLTEQHSSGDDFFWQCFFLASITSHSRRSGALAYLVRYLPSLGPPSGAPKEKEDESLRERVAAIVTTPEPGLLLRCFASGLSDEQLLIQRGFLDLLVTHLPLNSKVIQKRVQSGDLELLIKAAVGVVTRRDMSLNRRLWSWLLGPEPTAVESDGASETLPSPSEHHQVDFASRTSHFEEFGLQPLTQALLQMINGNAQSSAAERARPFRICLSLMDRWEIGGLVVPEVFLPVIESVRQFKSQASTKAEFTEVLRSASVFFDGIESGLIYGEIVGLLAQAIGPGGLTTSERSDRLSSISFILNNFNVREEEMAMIHAPLTCLAALSMLEDLQERQEPKTYTGTSVSSLSGEVLNVAISLLDLIPDRAFPEKLSSNAKGTDISSMKNFPNIEVLKRIRSFYVNDQGNIDASPPPFSPPEIGQLILQKTAKFIHDSPSGSGVTFDLGIRIRIFTHMLQKTSDSYKLDDQRLLSYLRKQLELPPPLPFSDFSSILQLSTQLYNVDRISTRQLSPLVVPIVRHAWSYISAPEPKYHVEAVRSLWQLQTSLMPTNRDIEAALSDLIASPNLISEQGTEPVDKGRAFSVLWSHTLQDNAGSERRGSRTPMLELRSVPRLAGMDNYEVMLTQPLFLILDALQDERTHLFMTVKSWLNSMIGIDRYVQLLRVLICF